MGSVLVGLLWTLALLAVLVVSVLHSSRMELRVVKNFGDAIQAHYLALAGVEKARALLFHDAANRRRASKNHTGELYNAPDQFQDVPLGRGKFRVIRQGIDGEDGGIVYGIRDEESRLNLNTASAEELGKLYGMMPETAAAIIDFRDQDSTPVAGGAELDYYSSLQPPYLPRNEPLQTVRELLMVRGVSQQELLGEDFNANGLLDPEEDDGVETPPIDNQDGHLETGWSGLITVHSSGLNVNAAGEDRVDVRSADEGALAQVNGISSEIAKAIVAWRAQNEIRSLADLLEVRALSNSPTPTSQSQSNNGSRGGSPSVAITESGGPSSNPSSNPSRSQPTGPALISEDLLLQIADDLTSADSRSQAGLININTAEASVLACLPDVGRELAQAIVSHRQSSGFFQNTAELLRVPGFTRDVFKQAAPKATVRSETFCILSEGTAGSTGARRRIQAVVRVSPTDVEVLSYREDL